MAEAGNERLVDVRPQQLHVHAHAPARTNSDSSMVLGTTFSLFLLDARLFPVWLQWHSGRMREANETCYASVREELRTLFGALCRNKTADLVMVGTKVRVCSWESSAEGTCPSYASDCVATSRLRPPRASCVAQGKHETGVLLGYCIRFRRPCDIDWP